MMNEYRKYQLGIWARTLGWGAVGALWLNDDFTDEEVSYVAECFRKRMRSVTLVSLSLLVLCALPFLWVILAE